MPGRVFAADFQNLSPAISRKNSRVFNELVENRQGDVVSPLSPESNISAPPPMVTANIGTIRCR